MTNESRAEVSSGSPRSMRLYNNSGTLPGKSGEETIVVFAKEV